MEFGELLKAYLVSLQGLFRQQIAGNGLTLPQVLVISSIPDTGLDMTALARLIGIDNSTLTRIADTMIRKGWLVKSRSDIDRRSFTLQLTDRGEILQRQIENRIDRLGDDLSQYIPPYERDETKEVLSSVYWKLSKMILNKQ